MKLVDIFARLRMATPWQAVRSWFRRAPETRLRGTTDGNALARQKSEIAELLKREWNQAKNGALTPNDIARGSGRKAWWKCETCGHEWEARVFSRFDGCGCPECAKVKAAWTRRNKKDKFQLQLFEANGSFPL